MSMNLFLFLTNVYKRGHPFLSALRPKTQQLYIFKTSKYIAKLVPPQCTVLAGKRRKNGLRVRCQTPPTHALPRSAGCKHHCGLFAVWRCPCQSPADVQAGRPQQVRNCTLPHFEPSSFLPSFLPALLAGWLAVLLACLLASLFAFLLLCFLACFFFRFFLISSRPPVKLL